MSCRYFSLIRRVCFVALVAAFFTSMHARASTGSDASLQAFHRLYQSVLNDAVYQGSKNGVQVNLVDYASLRRDDRVDQLMAFLADYDYEQLQDQSDRIAYFLNAYNIMAINKVCENWPLKSLRSLGNMFRPVWVHNSGKLNGEFMTLRALEHDILRQQGEPRIHFALNCASVSCPDLRTEPYTGAKLEAQLQDQTRRFFRQQGKGLKTEDNKLWLSPLIKWFEDDFDQVGGVDVFLSAYLPPPPENQQWQRQGFLFYDWEVNCSLTGNEKRTIRQEKLR